MTAYRQHVGRLGENIAKKFLRSRGFHILEENFSAPFGEIDLVAKQENYIVFVEVKARTSLRFGEPLAAITKQKQRHILRNCQYYLKRHNLVDQPWRVDAIGIELGHYEEFRVLRHVRNAIEL
ncbi:MAG: YraN family protein [Candidatus Omnitrophota bacterium]